MALTLNNMKTKKKEDEVLDYPNLGSKDTVKKLAEDYANYNYDTFTEGDSYKSLEKRYQTGGQKAMQDTVGQVSARTGGLASSYATVAGQQTYNDWMGNLESAARALYDSERQEMGDRYALANSMYLQERDEQRYADELAEKDRLEGEGKAYNTVVALINAGTPIDKIDPALIAQTGYDPSHFDAMAKSYTDNQTKETLEGYMAALSDGVFADRQGFIDAGGDVAIYDAYKTAYDEAKAKGEAEDKATLATNTLNTLINTKADVDWDSEEIQQLIKDSGKSKLEWNALIAQMNEDIQAEADAEAAAEIAAEEANAANDVIMYLVGETKTLDELEASGMLASTGQSRDWWEGYIAYQNKLNPQEVEKVAKFYEVDYDTVRGYMGFMDNITTENEAIDFKELVASATGNQKFADELYMRWLTMHSDIAVS